MNTAHDADMTSPDTTSPDDAGASPAETASLSEMENLAALFEDLSNGFIVRNKGNMREILRSRLGVGATEAHVRKVVDIFSS